MRALQPLTALHYRGSNKKITLALQKFHAKKIAFMPLQSRGIRRKLRQKNLFHQSVKVCSKTPKTSFRTVWDAFFV